MFEMIDHVGGGIHGRATDHAFLSFGSTTTMIFASHAVAFWRSSSEYW
jgi:hypothetical protein